MIETLFKNIRDRIKSECTSIRFIDFDDGQIDQEGPWPVSFPCALVDVDELSFFNAGDDCQFADISIVIKVAFQRHEGSNNLTPVANQPKAFAHLTTLEELMKGLHYYAPTDCEVLERVRLIREKRLDIRVYTITYKTTYRG